MAIDRGMCHLVSIGRMSHKTEILWLSIENVAGKENPILEVSRIRGPILRSSASGEIQVQGGKRMRKI
jgi:hypothetical protein